MVVHDVSAPLRAPLLTQRRHVDLCRLASALCAGAASTARA